MLLDYQGKLNNILDELKNNLNVLKTKFCKLESNMHISRNINDKLTDKLVVLERKCHANEQYSKRECLEISGIPAEVRGKDIEKKVLKVLDAIDAPVKTDLVEDWVYVYTTKNYGQNAGNYGMPIECCRLGLVMDS